MSAALPEAPLIDVLTNADMVRELPPLARSLYRRRTCTLLEASDFLGFKRKTVRGAEQPSQAAYDRAERYRARTDPVKLHPPYDANELLPHGDEIPAAKQGNLVVNARMLVWSVFPQVSPW